jgi:predicted LPLAT superfamily acyltransferase
MSLWKGKSRGGTAGYRIFIFLLQNINIQFSYALLRLVAAYFWVFSNKQPLFYFYQARLNFSKWNSYKAVYQNYVMLGQCLLDKITVMSGIENKLSFDFIGEEYLHELANIKTGGILIGAHFGNWEIAGHLLKRIGTKVHIVMLDAEHEKIKALLQNVSKEKLSVIPVKNNFDHLYAIEKALAKGELIAIHGDRFLPGAKTVSCVFLGEEALFPTGPFYLAAKFNVPVSFVSAIKTGKFHYRFNATKPKTIIFTNNLKTRNQDLKTLIDPFVLNLEEWVKEYPTQWFNFYQFWSKENEQNQEKITNL